jgi:hypothetical protein
VKSKIVGNIGNGEIVTNNFGLGHVKRHLITSQPSQVTSNSRSMDDWSSIQVNISIDRNRIMFEFRLQDSSLLAKMIVFISFDFDKPEFQKTYPDAGAKVESKVILRPLAIWSWMAISVPRVLSVFQRSVKVRP